MCVRKLLFNPKVTPVEPLAYNSQPSPHQFKGLAKSEKLEYFISVIPLPLKQLNAFMFQNASYCVVYNT